MTFFIYFLFFYIFFYIFFSIFKEDYFTRRGHAGLRDAVRCGTEGTEGRETGRDRARRDGTRRDAIRPSETDGTDETRRYQLDRSGRDGTKRLLFLKRVTLARGRYGKMNNLFVCKQLRQSLNNK